MPRTVLSSLRIAGLSVALSVLAVPIRADPLYPSVEANSACTEDACQMCAFGGSCFTQALAQCQHPACVILGIAGGVVGAIGGGVAGPFVFAPLAVLMYPGLDLGAALFGGIFVGAGLGCVAGGLPGMLCGTWVGESWRAGTSWWPWEAAAPPKRQSPAQRRKKRGAS
ncbi:MAG: hypothetical protein ABIJ09_25400 [Pseudomonadota bacterium]